MTNAPFLLTATIKRVPTGWFATILVASENQRCQRCRILTCKTSTSHDKAGSYERAAERESVPTGFVFRRNDSP